MILFTFVFLLTFQIQCFLLHLSEFLFLKKSITFVNHTLRLQIVILLLYNLHLFLLFFYLIFQLLKLIFLYLKILIFIFHEIKLVLQLIIDCLLLKNSKICVFALFFQGITLFFFVLEGVL